MGDKKKESTSKQKNRAAKNEYYQLWNRLHSLTQTGYADLLREESGEKEKKK